MILPIKHMADWEFIRYRNQTQINKDNIQENRNQSDHNYKVKDKVMINKQSAYKYETSLKGTFMITQCWTNGKVSLHCGQIKIRYNIHQIKPYIYDADIEDYNPKNMCDDVKI